MSHDVTPNTLKLKSYTALVEHEYALRKYETTKHSKETRLEATIALLQGAGRP